MQQTKITNHIIHLSKQFRGRDLDTLKEIMVWLNKNLKFKAYFAKKRSRTADEILQSGIVTGCIDVALTFIVLARALKFDITFVECIEKNWLTNKNIKDNINGHIFCRVNLGKNIFIINPTEKTISDKEIYFNKNKEYVPIKEGNDSWDIGFINNNDLVKSLEKNYNIKFKV